MTTTPSRRTVLGAAAGGAVVVGVASAATAGELEHTAAAVAVTPGVLDLYVNEGFVPMVDRSLVYMRGFGDRPTDVTDPEPSLTITPRVFLADGRLETSRFYPPDAEPPEGGRPEPAGIDPAHVGEYRIRRAHWASFFPRRTIIAETGSTVRLRVHNRLQGPHELAIPDVLVAGETLTTGVIQPGATAELTFTPVRAGTYAYTDPTNAPVERVLGLNGALVVVPANDRWRNSPGGTEFERQWLWLCQDVDPVWGRRARAGEAINPVATPALPRYFMLNDRSGFHSLAVSNDEEINLHSEEETLASGFPRQSDVRNFSLPDGAGSVCTGQMIRLVNLGVAIHQMHFHGNHVWTVRRNAQDFPRRGAEARMERGHPILQQWEDVVELNPMERKEIVLPVKRPPDVLDDVWNARTEDYHYPMHCHAEPSQTAAGGLYPGGLVADWVLAGPTSPEHPLFRSQAEFASNQPHEGSPVTEFRKQPDRAFLRKFYNRRLRFPDGAEFEMWSFEDETSGRRFPAPLIRITEDKIAHVTLEPSKRAHTIHLHGQEPDPRNDGVGHTSFEVTGSYTYQWKPQKGVAGDPNKGNAGSYFYHCHVNTVLHVQMGMLGPLIVDPVVDPAFPVSAGARRPFVDGPEYDIATEAMLFPFAVDPRWHELNHAAGLSGEDVGLNRFEPKNFYVLGGALAGPRAAGDVQFPKQLFVNGPAARVPTLLRVLNANYFPTQLTFLDPAGNPVNMGELIAHDGRPFRDTSNPDPTVRCLPVHDAVGVNASSPLLADVLAFGAAERYDMILRPPSTGTFTARFQWFNWVTGREIAVRTVPLIVR